MAPSIMRVPTRKKVVRLLDTLFAWCPVYKMAVGGYRYYNYTRERRRGPHGALHFGKDARIADGVEVYCPERCYLGDGASIEKNCSIHAVGGFHLGDYSGMATGCRVITTEHRFLGAEEIPFDEMRMIKPVWIEDYVWIGADVSILPGVRIGKGAVVGLGSVVRQDVPPMAIVCGNPVEIVGYRDEKAFDRLEAMGKGRDPNIQCSMLWIPPFVRRKYKDELAALGIDASDGQEYFEYIKKCARRAAAAAAGIPLRNSITDLCGVLSECDVSRLERICMAMTREALAGYLESRMGLGSHEYDDDTGLFSMGVLDSFSMVDLVMFIESHAGIQLDPSELSLDNLDSVNRILAFIDTRSD